jgi:hypothetical protein
MSRDLRLSVEPDASPADVAVVEQDTLFGTLEGYPPGYRQFFLAKRLQPAGV